MTYLANSCVFIEGKLVKQCFLLLCLMIGTCFMHEALASDNAVNVMTFNLRVPVDPAPYDWVSRKPRVLSVIQSKSPDFLGVQEAVPQFINDIQFSLQSYDHIGRGRDLAGAGEGSQIFYRKDRWQLDAKDYGTLQLSPTPDVVGSNGWNLQWPRIFTWGHFREKHTGKYVYIYNTHFPLKPEERDLSVALLSTYIANRKHPKDPVILTGDFNACEDEASMKYLQGNNASPITLVDTYPVIHGDQKVTSFHAFGKENNHCKIDYIFATPSIKALDTSVIVDAETEGFASDHYAVFASLLLKK